MSDICVFVFARAEIVPIFNLFTLLQLQIPYYIAKQLQNSYEISSYAYKYCIATTLHVYTFSKQ